MVAHWPGYLAYQPAARPGSAPRRVGPDEAGVVVVPLGPRRAGRPGVGAWTAGSPGSRHAASGRTPAAPPARRGSTPASVQSGGFRVRPGDQQPVEEPVALRPASRPARASMSGWMPAHDAGAGVGDRSGCRSSGGRSSGRRARPQAEPALPVAAAAVGVVGLHQATSSSLTRTRPGEAPQHVGRASIVASGRVVGLRARGARARQRGLRAFARRRPAPRRRGRGWRTCVLGGGRSAPARRRSPGSCRTRLAGHRQPETGGRSSSASRGGRGALPIAPAAKAEDGTATMSTGTPMAAAPRHVPPQPGGEHATGKAGTARRFDTRGTTAGREQAFVSARERVGRRVGPAGGASHRPRPPPQRPVWAKRASRCQGECLGEAHAQGLLDQVRTSPPIRTRDSRDPIAGSISMLGSGRRDQEGRQRIATARRASRPERSG
jgi:hypothetical protein